MRTVKTAVVLVPPEEVWEPIQAIRREHDRQVRRWMPHVTLLYPFRPAEEFDAVAPAIEEALRDRAPFEVTLAEFRWFRHRFPYFTLWLRPDPTEELVALQAALVAAVPDCDDTSRHRAGFTPHLSVGQSSGRRRTEALKAGLDAAWTPLRFTAAEVSLIRRGDPPDDVFEVARTVRLGG